MAGRIHKGKVTMKFNPGRLLAASLLLLTVSAPSRAQGTEEAISPTIPWSGWWWAAKTGNLVLGYRGEPGPLVKHDQVSGKHSATWEQGNPYHFNLTGPEWWGHCHAWAAAAILEPQPVQDVQQQGMTFHVGDMKGL